MSKTPKNMNEWTRKEFLALPQRTWSTVSQYASVVVFPSEKEHESGFGCLAIIGVNASCFPVELITTACDDIEWRLHGELNIGTVRTECLFKSSAFHFWSKQGYFQVSEALSSVTIEFFKH